MQTTEELLVRFGDDFRCVWALYAGPRERSPDQCLPQGAVVRTSFGVLHEGYGCGIPVHPPLAGARLSEVHAYDWPDPRWMDVSSLRLIDGMNAGGRATKLLRPPANETIPIEF